LQTPPHGSALRKGRCDDFVRSYLLTSVFEGRCPVFADWRLGRALVPGCLRKMPSAKYSGNNRWGKWRCRSVFSVTFLPPKSRRNGGLLPPFQIDLARFGGFFFSQAMHRWQRVWVHRHRPSDLEATEARDSAVRPIR
jgi:hypothetical protein